MTVVMIGIQSVHQSIQRERGKKFHFCCCYRNEREKLSSNSYRVKTMDYKNSCGGTNKKLGNLFLYFFLLKVFL